MRYRRWFGLVVTMFAVVGAVGCQLVEDDDSLADGGSTTLSDRDAATAGGVDAGRHVPDAATSALDGDSAVATTPITDAPTDAGRSVDAGRDAALSDEDAGLDGDDGGAVDPIEIAGTWTSNFGGTEVIDASGHTMWGSTSPIVDYDNTLNYFISRNADDAAYDPGKYNKVVWTEISGSSFYYCTVDYGLDTASDAFNTTNTADASDPANSGCGGFSWTHLDAP